MEPMTPTVETISLSKIVFDEGLYPRVDGHDPATVQVYARDIKEIEAAGKFISVNADGVLLDGRHRHLAYQKNADGKDIEVSVYRYAIKSPLESFRLACSLQDRGRALNDGDRVSSAKRLYALGDQLQKNIAATLGVSASTVSGWLSRTIKDEKAAKQAKAFSMWMGCATQQEIADAISVPQRTVSEWETEFSETSASEVSLKSSDFTPPIYNVWKTQTKSNTTSHFGNSEAQWVDNLLYLYTDPADIVLDPFAGGGSTIDVCKKRGRRYFVSDRKPIVERAHEIRSHDLTNGLPSVPRWKDVSLVYLDPPYWAQAAGQYSSDPTDLANMDLETFTTSLAGIIKEFAAKLRSSAREKPSHIAMILQPTQWRAPERQYTDHVADMIKAVKLPIDLRIQCPYESQQATPQMVDWAKANRKVLVLSREIVVWKVA